MTQLPGARLPRRPTPIPDRVAQRSAERFMLVWPTGCHFSTYSIASHGYAQVGWHEEDGNRVGTTAHRAAWVATHGQIPAGMTVDHLCRQKRCVNVQHLRLLTNFENARRSHGDWPLGQCSKGHPDTELVRHSGHVLCRACKNAYQRKRRALLRASTLTQKVGQ